MIEFGYQNYKNNKFIYKRTTISIIIGVFLVLFFTLMQNGLENIVQNELTKNPYLHEIGFSETISSSSETKPLFQVLDLDSIADLDYVSSIKMSILSKTEITKFRFVDYETPFPPSYLDGRNNNYDTFDLAELYSAEEDCVFEPIIAGRDFLPSDTFSALVEENCVIAYGMNPEDVIGKTITVFTQTDSIELTIVGVYSSALGNNSNLLELIQNNPDYAQFYINFESTIVSQDVITKMDGTNNNYSWIKIYCDSLESTSTLYENLSNRYSNLFFASISEINTIQNYLQIFGNIFIFSGAILFVLALFNINSIVVLTAEKRKKWFTIQYIIGFTKKEIAKSFSFEILLAVLKGYIIGIAISLFATLIMNGAIHMLAADYLTLGIMPFSLPLIPSSIMLGLILLFSLMLSISNSTKISKLDPISSLRSQ